MRAMSRWPFYAVALLAACGSKEEHKPCPEVTPEQAVKVFVTDRAGVKAALKARIHGTFPSAEDVRLLAAVCSNDMDEACVRECKDMLRPADAGTPSTPSSANMDWPEAGLNADGGHKTR